MLKFLDNLFDAFERSGEQLFYVGGFVREFQDATWHDDLVACNIRYEQENGVPEGKEPMQPSNERAEVLSKATADEMDVDLATSALPEKTMQILQDMGLKPIPIGIEFGTVQVMVPVPYVTIGGRPFCEVFSGHWKTKIEITTFRSSESYKKGSRKPAVVFGKTIEEDLARRDFTINAMAMKRDGTLVDPFGGMADLIQGIFGTPIEPEISFSDDPLRMLRACRFHAKSCGIDGPTARAMEKLAEKIKEISAERVFEEVSKILMTPTPSRGLQLMADTGLLRQVFPEQQSVVDFKQNQGKWHSKLVWGHTLQVVDSSPEILAVRWAALFHDVAKPQTYSETETGVHFFGHDHEGAKVWNIVADRLKVSSDFKERVFFLVDQHLAPAFLASQGPEHVTDKALRRFARECGDRLDDLFHLSLADITSHKPETVAEKKANCLAVRERIVKLLAAEDVRKLKLPSGTGTVVAEGLGFKIPVRGKDGERLGEIMRTLTQKLVDGEITLESDFVAVAKELYHGQKEA